MEWQMWQAATRLVSPIYRETETVPKKMSALHLQRRKRSEWESAEAG